MRIRLLVLGTAALLAAACQSPRSTQTSSSGAQKLDPTQAVAKVSGQTITAGELDQQVGKDLKQLEQQFQEQVYQLRRQALENMIRRRVVEAKAKAAGVTPEELVQKEVVSKVAEPSDDEVRALYERAKAGGQQLPPLDQVKPDIARFIKNQKAQGELQTYVQKLEQDAKMEILLPGYEPP
jgi:hypothetical protein